MKIQIKMEPLPLGKDEVVVVAIDRVPANPRNKPFTNTVINVKDGKPILPIKIKTK